MNDSEQWQLTIQHLMACNCNYGCPCAFNAPPTYRTCEAGLAYQIVDGRYGKVDLSGLAWAVAAKWPGPLHERNGRAVVYLDERSDAAQREALETITTGKAGGPIGIFMSTVTAGVEVRSAAIDLLISGKESRLRVGGEIDIAFGPIRNPVTGAEHQASALLPNGMLTKQEDFYSADTFSVNVNGLEFAYPGRNGLTFSSTWRGP